MAKRRKKRRGGAETKTVDYADAEGNVLTLRSSLSGATIRKINEPPTRRAASREDAWHRREEMLFERLAVDWEIAGLPIGDQKMLLGRYRLADSETQAWVRATIDRHIAEHIPELLEG